MARASGSFGTWRDLTAEVLFAVINVSVSPEVKAPFHMCPLLPFLQITCLSVGGDGRILSAWWLVPSSSRRFQRSRSPSPRQGAVATSQPPNAVTSAKHRSALVTASVPEMARPFTFTASDPVATHTVSFVSPRAAQQTLAGQGAKLSSQCVREVASSKGTHSHLMSSHPVPR